MQWHPELAAMMLKLALLSIVAVALVSGCSAGGGWSPQSLNMSQINPVKIRGKTCSRFDLGFYPGTNKVILSIKDRQLPGGCDLTKDITMTTVPYDFFSWPLVCSSSEGEYWRNPYFSLPEKFTDRTVYFPVDKPGFISFYSDCASDFDAFLRVKPKEFLTSSAAEWTPQPLHRSWESHATIKAETCSRFRLNPHYGRNKVIISVKGDDLPETCEFCESIKVTVADSHGTIWARTCSLLEGSDWRNSHFHELGCISRTSAFFTVYNIWGDNHTDIITLFSNCTSDFGVTIKVDSRANLPSAATPKFFNNLVDGFWWIILSIFVVFVLCCFLSCVSGNPEIFKRNEATKKFVPMETQDAGINVQNALAGVSESHSVTLE